MAKKSIIIYIIIFLLVIVSYFSYKGFILYQYNKNNESYSKVVDGLTVKNTITLRNIELEDNEYLEFNDIKIKNEFTGFEKQEKLQDSFTKYVLYNSDKSIKALFLMEIEQTYIEKFKSESTLFTDAIFIPINISLTKFLEKNNISNDIKLFEYLKNKKDVKYNIFSSSKNINENHAIQIMSSIMLPSGENISLINGDYIGYIFNFHDNLKEVNILKNNKRYIFTFFSTDYFTDEYIEKILNTIVIE